MGDKVNSATPGVHKSPICRPHCLRLSTPAPFWALYLGLNPCRHSRGALQICHWLSPAVLPLWAISLGFLRMGAVVGSGTPQQGFISGFRRFPLPSRIRWGCLGHRQGAGDARCLRLSPPSPSFGDSGKLRAGGGCGGFSPLLLSLPFVSEHRSDKPSGPSMIRNVVYSRVILAFRELRGLGPSWYPLPSPSPRLPVKRVVLGPVRWGCG